MVVKSYAGRKLWPDNFSGLSNGKEYKTNFYFSKSHN